MTTTINAEILSSMIIAGANHLNENREYINELNVFPVPDGDTGTNMSLTIMSAANDISNKGIMTMKELAKCASTGSLRGARGNSGVILSQLIRGFCRVIADYEELNIQAISKATVYAVETAYKAVMRPKEGTILTVAKSISNKAVEISDEEITLIDYFDELLKHGRFVLSQTPDMLPVLKEAGVVDAGGEGLIVFLEGAFGVLSNDNFVKIISNRKTTAGASDSSNKSLNKQTNFRISEEDIKFGYCTEFIININNKFTDNDETEFKTFLSEIGDSIVCVPLDDIIKVHVHTNNPGTALTKALTYGELTNIKIDNMREEHRERLMTSESKDADNKHEINTSNNIKHTYSKKYGFITVSIGNGFEELFNELGCDVVISGGQTMNPSTNDILSAIENTDAENIYILPNNKNIILSANQAKDLTEDKNIIVIHSKSIPQGIAAMLNFDEYNDIDTNTANLNTAIQNIKTAEITYSIRNTTIDEREIHKNDYMGINDSGIISNGTDILKVALESTKSIAENTSMISVYCGSDVKQELKESFEKELTKELPDHEIAVLDGGQPVYYFIISAE